MGRGPVSPGSLLPEETLELVWSKNTEPESGGSTVKPEQFFSNYVWIKVSGHKSHLSWEKLCST